MRFNATLYSFTGAAALMALVLTITVMAAPWSTARNDRLTDTYGRDYLALHPAAD